MGENELFCYTCSIGFSSVVNLKEHNLSLMHHKVYDHQMKNNGSKFPKHECFLCNKWMMIDSWEHHIRSKRHQQFLEQMRTAIMSNKSWVPPAPPPARNSINPGQGYPGSQSWGRGSSHSRDSSASSQHSRSHSTSPVFGGTAWARPMGPPMYPYRHPPPGHADWAMPHRQFRQPLCRPPPPIYHNNMNNCPRPPSSDRGENSSDRNRSENPRVSPNHREPDPRDSADRSRNKSELSGNAERTGNRKEVNPKDAVDRSRNEAYSNDSADRSRSKVNSTAVSSGNCKESSSRDVSDCNRSETKPRDEGDRGRKESTADRSRSEANSSTADRIDSIVRGSASDSGGQTSLSGKMRVGSRLDVRSDGEVDVLLERAQAMQDKFRKQREETQGRKEVEKKEEAKKPIKEIDAKLKAAGEANMKKIKGLLEKSPTPLSRSSSVEEAHRNPVSSKAGSDSKLTGSGRQTLMNMISMPRSRREKRQVEDIIRKHQAKHGSVDQATQRRTQRPRLQPQPTTTPIDVDESQEEDTLSVTMMEVIRRHEKEDEQLPTVDLNLEDITSGVTSLSNTARTQEPGDPSVVLDTERSDVSSVSPAAKKRRVDAVTKEALSSKEKTVEAAGGMEVAPSEEVTRMQMALELSVQEEDLKQKMKELDLQIDDQKKIMDAVLRRIEELEAKKTKIRLEERAVHERRMEILKQSYTKVTTESDTSMTSVTEQTESAVVDSSVPSSSCMSTVRSVVKSETTETTEETSETPTTSVQEIEEEEESEECTPLIGNMTAREIRERAMAVIEGGAMSFGDLDDVLNELMRVSKTQDDSVPDTSLCDDEPTPETVEVVEEVPKQKKQPKRRRKKSTDEGTSGSDTVAPVESVVSDVMSTRTSPRRADKARKSRNSCSSPGSSEEQPSTVSTVPPIAAFPGSIEVHKGLINDVQLFRGQAYTCGDDGRIRRYNLQTHECVKEYEGFSNAVRCLCVTEKPKGKPRIFSGGVEKLMIVHDLKTGAELQRLSMDAQIHCMHLFWFSLYFGLSNGVIVSYDVRKNRVISSRKVSSCEIRSLQATREGSRRVLVVACADGSISVRDVNSGNHMHSVGDVENPKDSLKVRVLLQSVYAIADDGKLREFSVMGNAVKKPRKLSSKITSIYVQTTKELLFLGCQDGSIRIIGGSEDNSARMKVYYTTKRSAIIALTSHIIGDNGLILAGNKDGQLYIIKFTETSKECKTPGCSLDFEFDDDIIYHVTRDHVLASNERDVRCSWNNTCKHRYTKLDNEIIEKHLRSHL